MGTVQHHQSRSDALLRHAHNATEAAIAAPATPGPHPPDYIDPFIDGLADAADSIQRAAAHAATALAVHIGLRHNTTRRLQIALTDAIFCDHLRRGHLRTFRHTYTLAAVLNLPTPAYKIASLARAAANAGHAGNAGNAGNAGHTASAGNAGHVARRRPHRRTPHATTGLRVPIGHTPMGTTIQTIRKMRKRVASLKNAIFAIIAGRPKLVRPAKRSLRFDIDFVPTTPTDGEIQSAGEITRLPYYQKFVKRYDLTGIPMSTNFDLHPSYGNAARRLCRCAPEPRHLVTDHDRNIILVPQWRAALADAYPHLQIPHLLPL